LATQRGEKWQQFIEQISNKPVGDRERRAFVLFMARLANCMTCHSDTWRAHQGCEQCSKQTIRKFRGSDEELIALYQMALDELAASQLMPSETEES